MSEPQRQVDADLANSMDLFQRADVGDVTAIEPVRPSQLLIALDGSAQDIAAVQLGKQLRERFQCRVAHLSPIPADVPKPRVTDGLEEFSTAIEPTAETSYDSILAATDATEADLVIVPCPFGRDFKSIGEDSTGTVVDVLIARSSVPFIAVRKPVTNIEDPTQHVRLVLTGTNPAADLAARRAVSLVHSTGRLDLLLLVEESFYQNFRQSLSAIDPDAKVSYEDLEHALARTYARLHTSLHRTADAMGFEYELLIRNERDEAPITPGDPKTHPALIVLGLERREHDSRSEIHDYICRSPHSVLVASTD
jgi:hypothetical protein